jgi:hypothetical protein
MESDWRGLAANQYEQCSGATLQQRNDFCNMLPLVLRRRLWTKCKIAAGLTAIVAP